MTKAAVLKQKVFRYIKDKIRAKTPTMRQCQITISETRKKESSSQAELEFGLNKRAEFEQKEDINNSLLKKKILTLFSQTCQKLQKSYPLLLSHAI